MSFYYDHRTHWVTNTELDPILVAVGDFQSEMGCPTDGDVTCMRSWLQDPDRDGTYSFTTDIPPGTYETKAAVGLSWDESYGTPSVGNVAFTVGGDSDATTFSYRHVDERVRRVHRTGRAP